MKKSLLLLLFAAISTISYTQLTVQNGFTAQQLGENLAGSNVTITNASVTGTNQQSGTFTFNGTGLGVNSGVILSTGNIFDAPGPNTDPGMGTDMNQPGNPLLDQLAGFQTFDACVLQFDFEVQGDEIQFNYNFLSEEYNEFVNSGFNDVFAFYISGPGIVGEENLAVVPGTTTPVTINSINNGSFWQFYNDNTAGGTNIEFDGFTTLMTASKSGLTPCGIYTLKLMIADGSDGIYDAAVLLQENSLIQPNISALANTVNADGIALEGCIQASFTFNLDGPQAADINIPFTIGGTATNGVDYAYIDSILTIPAGQSSATIIIDAFADGISEGQEYIDLIFQPEICSPPDTVRLYIDDNQPIQFALSGNDLTCFEDGTGEVDIAISGGNPPFTITLTDTVTGNSSTHMSTALPITGLDATTYLVEIQDIYGCEAEAVVIGGDFNAGTTFLPDGTGVSYTSDIVIAGFNNGQTLDDINQFQSICATMEHSYANDLTIELEAPNGTMVELKNVGPTGCTWCTANMGEPVASAPVDQWNASNTTPGIGYEYCWTLAPTYGVMTDEITSGNVPQYTYTSTFGNSLTDYYLPQGSYTPSQNLNAFVGTELNGTWTLHVTDNYALDNGYIFDWNISLTSDLPDSTITLNEPDPVNITGGVTSAACGASDGAIDITAGGDFPPFTFSWSDGASVIATSEDVSGLTAGTYTVTVTDANNCSRDTSFIIPNTGGPTITGTITEVSCQGGTNGGVDAMISGGTAPYSFSWSNSATTEDISGLTAGNYQLTVTDNAGCISIESFDVTQIQTLSISASIINENCGDAEGAVDITITGGTMPYSFNWSNGATTEDIDEIIQGTYDVTVTDANGCQANGSYDIINLVGNCVPDCDLAISSSSVTDENCGNGMGAIDISIFTTNSPYSISWSNSETTEDINTLSSGNYTVTINDAEGCELTQQFTVSNQTGGLSATNQTVANETCGNSNGSIDVLVTGGAMPYAFSWSNGATTEDLSNIAEGFYELTVTDANGCEVSTDATIINDAGTLSLDFGNAVDEVCGNSQGSIDILVSGGQPIYTYQWTNGSNTEDLIGLSAGDYTCTITDGNGCSITTPTYTVNNQSGTLSIDNTDLDNEVCSNGLGEIELVLSGGSAPYSFNWNTGATTQDLFNLSAGTYSCTISDASGCSVSTGNLVLINESGTLSLDNVSTTDEICGNNMGAIDITVSSGTTPYTFAWNTGSSSEDLTGLAAGNYSCTITDANGCEQIANALINLDNGTLSIDNEVVIDEYCGDGVGSIDLIISGGAMPYSYSWSNGATTEDLANLNAGTYDYTVTDAAGCQANGSLTVNNNTGSLSIVNVALTNENCSDANGSIDLTIGGGQAPISYSWDNGATTEDITGLSAGTFTCTITDNAGCIITSGPHQVNNTGGGITISNANITDENCGDGAGAIDISVNGGSVPLTFSWDNGANTEDIAGLSAGFYEITITDAVGCQEIESYEVINTTGGLTIDQVNIVDEICSNSNGSIDITVSGGATPYTFSWNTGATTEDLASIAGGTYSVTITDNNGCQVSNNSINVSNNSGSFLLQSINTTDENCGDGTGEIDVTLTGGIPPIAFNWNTGATSEDLTGLNAGIYNGTATDNNGCIVNLNAVVSNNSGNMNIANEIITNATCGNANGSIDITVGGGDGNYTYAWSTGATTEDITMLTAGNYTLVVNDGSGCQTNYNASVSDLGGDLSIASVTLTNEECNNGLGEIDILMSGGTQPYVYSWSNGATTEDISGLNSGTYDVTVTDDNGCDVQGSYNVTNQADFQLDPVTIVDEICNNAAGSIDIEIDAQQPIQFATYTWSNGATTEDITNLGAGTYTVDVLVFYGFSSSCALSETFTVNSDPSNLSLSSSVTDENCGDGAGAIDLTISGGTAPYDISWDSGSTDEDLTALNAGQYIVTVSDANGCQAIETANVLNQTAGLSATAVVTDENCGDGTGGIDVTVSGGTSPYSFAWIGGQTTEDLTSLNEGVFEVTITDDVGCSFTETYTVLNNTGTLAASNEVVVDETCGQANGSINLDITGGSSPYTYNWSNSETTEDISGLSAGTYNLTVTDNAGCIMNLSYDVDGVNGVIVSDTVITFESCVGCTDASINITVDDQGTNPLSVSYNWDNGATTEDIFGLTAGTYTVTISTDYGGGNICQTIETYTVIVDPNASIDENDPLSLEVNLFPNPSTGVFNVQLNRNLYDADLRVMNSLGQVVFEMDASHKEDIQLDLSGLETGIYLIQIEEKGISYVKRAMIRH